MLAHGHGFARARLTWRCGADIRAARLPRRLMVRLRFLIPTIEVRILAGHPHSHKILSVGQAIPDTWFIPNMCGAPGDILQLQPQIAGRDTQIFQIIFMGGSPDSAQ